MVMSWSVDCFISLPVLQLWSTWKWLIFIWFPATTLTVLSWASIVLIVLIALIAVVEDMGQVVTSRDTYRLYLGLAHGYGKYSGIPGDS